MMKKIESMSDEKALEVFLKLLETRVSITTNFVVDDTGTLTHQVLIVSCGDLSTVSNPEPLEVPLRPATGAEIGATVN